MWKHAVAVCAVFIPDSLAFAGAIIEVLPVAPPPYVPGQRVEIRVGLRQQPGGEDVYLRGIRLDFADSDPALRLDHTFRFDYSAQALCAANPAQCGRYYAEFPHLQHGHHGVTVNTVYQECTYDPISQIRLPDSGSIPVGTIGLTLPTLPGEYLLELMNADTQDAVNFGAAIYTGFSEASPTGAAIVWHAADSAQLAGGWFSATTTADAGLMFGYTPVSGVIVPEPVSVVLLVIGGPYLLRRCRTR